MNTIAIYRQLEIDELSCVWLLPQLMDFWQKPNRGDR